MLKLLYCNVYYRPPTHLKGEGISCEYTETEKEVPAGTYFLQEAGCVQEAQRLMREEQGYLLDQGRELLQALVPKADPATDPTP